MSGQPGVQASRRLEIDFAWRTEAGDKPENADACDAIVPKGETLRAKGVAAAIADGMSSSEGGREAAEVCVKTFLTDYLSTPDSWTVRTATSRVLGAINRWLWGQGQTQYDSPRGMVTTFTGLVIKSATAHIVHVGDSRLYRYRDGDLEQLTRDHRVWVSEDREFLSRAMGADPHVDIDYKSLPVQVGDLFMFSTDGIHEYLTRKDMVDTLQAEPHLQACVNQLVEKALHNGSHDNVTCQLLRVVGLPPADEEDLYQQINELPFPPSLSPGVTIDGYRILRELHASKRSEVFLALDTETDTQVVLKTPSENFRDDPEFLNGFLHEEWVGKRVNNTHLLKMLEPRQRRFLYNISEYVAGRSLAQWMQDNGPASLDQMRDFARQIIDGLRALHRLEMYHQDLKPDNVLVGTDGVLKLIDFGAVRIAGEAEIDSDIDCDLPQGTLNYAAPECLRGEPSTKASDLFSLGVMLYELLTGKLPYGESDTPRPKCKLNYTPARRHNPAIPPWVDAALEKAVSPLPQRRYHMLSELEQDLSHPNKALLENHHEPLVKRYPVGFWQGVALLSVLANILLLFLLARPG